METYMVNSGRYASYWNHSCLPHFSLLMVGIILTIIYLWLLHVLPFQNQIILPQECSCKKVLLYTKMWWWPKTTRIKEIYEIHHFQIINWLGLIIFLLIKSTVNLCLHGWLITEKIPLNHYTFVLCRVITWQSEWHIPELTLFAENIYWKTSTKFSWMCLYSADICPFKLVWDLFFSVATNAWAQSRFRNGNVNCPVTTERSNGSTMSEHFVWNL